MARTVVIAAVFLLMLAPDAHALVQPVAPGWQPPNRFASLNDKPEYVFLLILDGGLPSYLNLADFPHIAALQRQGVTFQNAWDGMLESETPTGHASLGTGSLPRRHGIVSFSWYTDQNVEQHPTNPIPIQQGNLEQILRASGVPSIASLVKKHNPNDLVVVTSGHKDYAVDSVGGWAADYLMYYVDRNQTWMPVAIPRHVPPRSIMQAPGLTAYAPHLRPGDQDSLAIQLALSAFRTVHQKVTIVNAPEFDWPLGHLDGGEADRYHAWQLTQRLDQDIGAIEWQLSQSHVLDKTLFVVTADHGMATLNHNISYQDIEKAVSDAGTSLADYDFHTAGYLWLRDRSKAWKVSTNIMKLHNPLIRAVYYRKPGTYDYVLASPLTALASKRVNAAYQFLLGTLAGPSAPQVVIFPRENTSIRGRNQTNWRGDHGGASWNAQHIPLIIAGPGVRHDVQLQDPATIYDVAPTILTLLDIAPQGMDGLPLAGAFANPDPALTAAEDTRDAELAPLQKALRYQSFVDGP